MVVAVLIGCALKYGAYIRHGSSQMEIAAATAFAATIPLYYFARILPLRRFQALRTKLSIPAATRNSWLKREVHTEVHRRTIAEGEAPILPEGKHVNVRIEADAPQFSIARAIETTSEPASAQKRLADQRLQKITAMPPLRPVRLTRRGMIYACLVGPAIVAACCGLSYAYWKNPSFPGSPISYLRQDWGYLIGALIAAALLIRFFRKIPRDRWLLAEGNVCLGQVVRQVSDRYGVSTITYSFSDARSGTLAKSGTDYSM